MNKKIITLILSLGIIFGNYGAINAANNPGNNGQGNNSEDENVVEEVVEEVVISEEEACFTLLNEKVKTDSRFQNLDDVMPNGDLTEVLFSESGGSNLNLSDYNTFQEFLSTNPAHRGSEKRWREDRGLTENDFLSRRTNIATVIARDNFIVSQVVGFGRDSNFDFPVEAEYQSYGDKYSLNGPNFKEFVLYTHHSITGDFLSCGLFRLVPLNERGYGNVSEQSYFTNTLQGNNSQNILGNRKCSSGFEGQYLSEDDKDYYSMKTNVCSLDYSQEDFVKQEILAVAYDNDSNYFNEYEIFPEQVSAMRDTDLTSNGLAEVRSKFLEYIKNRTSLRLVDRNLSNEMGNNNLFSFIIDKLIPNASAARDFNFSEEEIEDARGIVIYESLPYDLFEKLEKIPSKNFVEYIKLALTPNFEDYIQYRKDNNIVLSSYEKTFVSCGLDYEERNNVVTDFLENLENPENFNPSDVSYSNKKFGDCIVPYPDRENRTEVIENSFESNKILAQKLNGNYEAPEVEDDIIEMIEEENKIRLDYQIRIDELTQNYNEGLINGEELEEQTNNEKEELNEKLNELENKYTEVFIESSENEDYEMIEEKNETKNNTTVYIVVSILMLLGIGLLILAFYKNKNK